MNYNSLDDEKTRVRGAVSDEDIIRRSQKRNNGEWVTAANARVRESQLSDKSTRQNIKPNTQARPRDTEKKRDVLSEFTSPDGYTKGRSRPLNFIDEGDTESMTVQRKGVSASDIQRRLSSQAQNNRQSAPTRPQGIRVAQAASEARRPQATVPSIAQSERQNTRTAPPSGNAGNRGASAPTPKTSSEWTSVKSTRVPQPAKKAPPPEAPRNTARSQGTSKIQAQRRDINYGRKEKQFPPPPKKRVFTPIDAEEIILKEPIRRGHIISPFTGIFILVSAILALVCVILCVSMSTRVTRISVKTDDIAHINAEIVKVCEKYTGKSYLTLDNEAAEKEISEISALVASVEIKGAFPRRLYISVTCDTPRYYAEDTMGLIYIMSSSLKVLHIYGSSEDYETEGLTKLALPYFTADKVGQMIEFDGVANYVRIITEALADYSELGDISYVSFANTQRIYFIFGERFRCDLGNSSEIELKLKAAESTFRKNVLPALGENTDRTALINVTTPSSATYRLDAELGITE